MSLAACRDVSVVYGEGEARVTALEGVDLAIEGAETLALRGRSGSGKTTLLHVLGGLVEPTTGVVDWQGRPLSTLDAAARAQTRSRGLAYVFQSANLLPHFTAFENVAFAVQASNHAERKERFQPLALLELVGLTEKADNLPAELSGGEAQRVAIAAAAARESPLVLADEPTAELDERNERIVLEALARLRSQFGSTVVVVTHSPRVADAVDRVIELRDGRAA